MKTAKKLAAALLVLCMMIPLFCAGSVAHAKSYKGKSLVVIGDSIAAGFGLNEYVPETTLTQAVVMAHGEFVKGSFPQIVRDKGGFSKATSVNLSRNMWCSTEFLRLLDPAFEANLCEPENAFDQYVSDYMMFPSEALRPTDTLRLAATIKKTIKKADVLIFSLGSNDIMTYSICKPIMRPFYQVFGRQAAVAISLATQREVKTLDSPEEVAKFVLGPLDMNLLPQDVAQSTKRFYKQYDRLLSIIYKLNPKVRVISIGITAPFRGLKIMDGVDEQMLSQLNE
ncbi:MAG: hypothetical protein J6T14_08935, partial [Clostridia bacterium]|nr:hypothetical protein [Clostridia bacterium]